jgi:hypothetical protein
MCVYLVCIVRWLYWDGTKWETGMRWCVERVHRSIKMRSMAQKTKRAGVERELRVMLSSGKRVMLGWVQVTCSETSGAGVLEWEVISKWV